MPIIGDFKFYFVPIVGTDGSLSSLFDSAFSAEEDKDRFFKVPQTDYSEVSEFLLKDFKPCN